VKLLREKARKGMVTFVYSTRDQYHNGAQILKKFVKGR
jgi:uncharacterized protein YeaO (DUF488 family)